MWKEKVMGGEGEASGQMFLFFQVWGSSRCHLVMTSHRRCVCFVCRKYYIIKSILIHQLSAEQLVSV